MSEVKHSEIIYEEGWRDASAPAQEVTPIDEEKPPAEKTEETPQKSKPWLITLQLTLSLLAALVLFLLKTMDSPAYHEFIGYYREELQKPLISQEVFSAADVSRLFSDPAVRVEATPDETAPRGD